MASVSVKPQVPHEFMIPQPASQSAHLLRKRQVEVLPSENSTFSYATNDRIVVNLSSQTEFLDANNCYLKGNIKAVLIDDADVPIDEATKALDEGGVMSCFRSIELRTQSGVLIERWDRANRLFAMISNATHSRYFVESSLGTQLDSVGFSSTEVDQFSAAAATQYKASRAQIQGGVAGTDVQFCMKIPLGFFNMVQFIPLMLIKQGLQLVFELERPELAMNSHEVINGNLTSTITFSNMRFVGQMITPDESVVGEYLSKYNGEGLHYGYQTWRHRRKNVGRTDSEASLSYQFGVRSARAVFTIIQSALLSDTASKTAQNYDSISTFLGTNIERYQYKSGAEEYPNHEVVLYDGTNANGYSEAFDQLMLAVNQFGSKIHQTRFLPYQWRPENTVGGVADESSKLILAADLSRGNSPWTGLDLSINNLDLDLKFHTDGDATFGDRVIHCFILHDQMVSISQEAGIVIRR